MTVDDLLLRALADEIEGLRLDAARYQWLRANWLRVEAASAQFNGSLIANHQSPDDARLDDAVDAAMKAQHDRT